MKSKLFPETPDGQKHNDLNSASSSGSSANVYIGDPPINGPLTGDCSKTPISNGFGVEYCGYRLPCGICTKLGYMCPMQFNKYEITCSNSKNGGV